MLAHPFPPRGLPLRQLVRQASFWPPYALPWHAYLLHCVLGHVHTVKARPERRRDREPGGSRLPRSLSQLRNK